MAAFLQSIGDFILSVVQLLYNFVLGIFQLLSMLPGAMAMVTGSIASMPLVLIAFATGLISISVVYLIIGR